MDFSFSYSIRKLPKGGYLLCDPEGVPLIVNDAGQLLLDPKGGPLKMKSDIEQFVRKENLGPVVHPQVRPTECPEFDNEKMKLAIHNVQRYINWAYHPSFNTREQTLVAREKPLPDEEVKCFHQRMAEEGHPTISAAETQVALIAVGKRFPFDPVLLKVQSLHTGMTEAEMRYSIKSWLQLTEAWEVDVWIHWAVAAISRLYDPGQLIKQMPVLFGQHDNNKSSFVRALGLGFSGEMIVGQNERDTIISANSKWIWEIPEIEKLKKNWGWARAKSWISTTHDTWTPKRANFAKTEPRRWVGIGTTNSFDMLSDPNAATRLPHFRVKSPINTDEVKKEAEAFWAGARQLYLEGFRPYPNKATEAQMKGRAMEFRPDSPVEDRIAAYLEESGKKEISLHELARWALDIEDAKEFTRAKAKEIGYCMDNLGGWTRSPTRPNRLNPFQGGPSKVKATLFIKDQ